jgi:hypothetical protein
MGDNVEATFKTFASKGNEATSSDIIKWAKDSNILGKNLTTNHIDIAFSKVKVKGAKNLTVRELGPLIDEMAVKYMLDKKLDKDAAVGELREKLGGASSKMHGVTKAVAVGGVDRLTDTSKYTGSHKERFDAEGKGKGLEGREDLHDNSGYVGGYKGAGTYDSK